MCTFKNWFDNSVYILLISASSGIDDDFLSKMTFRLFSVMLFIPFKRKSKKKSTL